MKLFSLAVLLFALLLSSVPVLAVPDSLLVDVRGTSFQSPTGIWWPKAAKAKVKTLRKTAPVVVWFHGGMGSANCAKGLVAGTDFAELYHFHKSHKLFQ